MRATFTPVYKQQESHESVGSRVHQSNPIQFGPIIKIILGLALGVGLVFLGIFLARTNPAPAPDAPVQVGNEQKTLSDREIEDLMTKVRRHMVLPKDETPQIVQIANVEQLRVNQPFFRSAQNGDQLLVYGVRVILYRPSSDQIVDIAQIRSSPAAANTGTPTQSPTPTRSQVFSTWTPTPVPQFTPTQ